MVAYNDNNGVTNQLHVLIQNMRFNKVCQSMKKRFILNKTDKSMISYPNCLIS